MLIIGCGNRERSDDAAGVLVAERLRSLGVAAQVRSGEALGLIEAWAGADEVIVVDATISGAAPGAVRVWSSDELPLLAGSRASASTHGLGVAEAVQLAQTLGRLPRRLWIYGIEGWHFALDGEVSPPVRRAVEQVVQQILTQVHSALPDEVAGQSADTQDPGSGETRSSESPMGPRLIQEARWFMQVKDIMMVKPSYCEPYWTVEAVASLMDHVGTGILPVVQDILSRKLLGVVTDRDLCVRVVAPGLYPAHIWIKDCMTPNPVCCYSEDSLETAVQLMKDKQVRRLPVVNQQMQLMGMLSISDFVRCELPDREMVYEALKQICQPCVAAGQPRTSAPRAA